MNDNKRKAVYIGSKPESYMLEKYCQETGTRLVILGNRETDPCTIIDSIAAENADIAFYDIEALIFRVPEDKTRFENLIQRTESIGIKTAIVAPGYALSMEIIRYMISLGIDAFILSLNLSEQRTQIESILSANSSITEEKIKEIVDSNERKAERIIKEVPEAAPKEVSEEIHKIRIAVAGSERRIGTTTQAMSLAKIANLDGRKACIIEQNDNPVSESLIEYAGSCQDMGNYICCHGIDIYSGSNAHKVLSEQYEVYIYDFGDIHKANNMSVLEKDAVLAVAGAKPWEVSNAADILEILEDHKGSFFMFSFTSENDNILDLMENKKDRCAKASYNPNPEDINMCNADFYRNILSCNAGLYFKSRKRKRGLLR